jgi:Putative transposase
VLAYLGRYTHRVAIANRRLVSCDQDHVAFTWKDYRQNGATKLMRLAPHEFIRRFLLHTLPDGFHRIRHIGFLANRHRAMKLALCRALLDTAEPSAAVCIESGSLPDRNDAPACPLCGGIMRITSLVPPSSADCAGPGATFRCDTS